MHALSRSAHSRPVELSRPFSATCPDPACCPPRRFSREVYCHDEVADCVTRLILRVNVYSVAESSPCACSGWRTPWSRGRLVLRHRGPSKSVSSLRLSHTGTSPGCCSWTQYRGPRASSKIRMSGKVVPNIRGQVLYNSLSPRPQTSSKKLYAKTSCELLYPRFKDLDASL